MPERPGTQPPPSANVLTLAVMVSLAFVGFVFSVGVAIAGSYALTIHEVHVAQQAAVIAQQRAQSQAATAQVRASIPECRALIALDQADVPPPAAAAAIHQVVANSQCVKLLTLVHQGDSASAIVKKLGE